MRLMGILEGFDDAFEDGRMTNPSPDLSFLKDYDVGAMIRKANELKRPLTNEEVERFRRKKPKD